MLIFLPPAEAKHLGGGSPPLREIAAQDAVTAFRRRLLSEVAERTEHDPRATATALRIPAGAAEEASAWNRAVLDSPTMPALDRYAGVVYASLDPASLTRAQRARALRCVRIFSGGFGYLRADELVPLYRVAAAGRLPGVGGVGARWRPVLRDVVTADVADHLVVDLRSTDYAAMWRPPKELQAQVVSVRVLSRTSGVEKTISYNSKRIKGLLTRALVSARGAVDTAERVAEVADAIGYEVREGESTTLEVVEQWQPPLPR